MKSKILFGLGTIACLFATAVAKDKEEVPDHKLSEFTLGDHVSGKEVNLSKQKGKVVVIEYWGTRCGPCFSAMPHLVQMEKKYAKKGLTIVAPEVQGSSVEDIQKVVKDKKLNYTITKSISGPRLGSGIPRMAVFNTKGKLVFAGHPMSKDAEKAVKTALREVKESGSDSKSSSIFDKKKNLVDERSWTNAEGKSIKATLISLDADTGHFQFPNGRKFDYDIKKLSEEDQTLIKEASTKSEEGEEDEDEDA